MGNQAINNTENKSYPSLQQYNFALSKTKQMGPKSLVFSKLTQKIMQEEHIKQQTHSQLPQQSFQQEIDDPDCQIADVKQSQDIQQIKIKWNSFIKMKTINYLDQYSIVKQIGKGGFGTVSKVVAKFTGVVRAAKKIKKSALGKQQTAKLFQQMAIMITLDHPNIARLYEVYDYKSSYVLILQLCQGGQLFKKIVNKQINQSGAAYVMAQLLNALQYLHSHGVVHRDLKPQNMLFQKNGGNIKLIDFGIAAKIQKGKPLTSRIGTPYYIAPQVLLKNYNEKCDIWSAGIILYMMMAQKPPFFGQNQHQVMQNILKTQPVFKSLKLPGDCIDLMRKMLVKNPVNRISAAQAWQHPWIQRNLKSIQTQQRVDGAINNISTFKFNNRFQAVVYTYIVSQIFTSEQKYALKQIFAKLDRNHDGVISSQQLKEAILSHGSMGEERINFLMRMIDTNGSGQIDYTQFIVAALEPDAMKNNHFEQAFAYFDIDHSGVITYEEIAAFLQNKQNCQEQIRNIFKDVDQNHDGEISKEEFVAVLAKRTKQNLSGLKKTNKKKQKDSLNQEKQKQQIVEISNGKQNQQSKRKEEKRKTNKKSTQKDKKDKSVKTGQLSPLAKKYKQKEEQRKRMSVQKKKQQKGNSQKKKVRIQV